MTEILYFRDEKCTNYQWYEKGLFSLSRKMIGYCDLRPQKTSYNRFRLSFFYARPADFLSYLPNKNVSPCNCIFDLKTHISTKTNIVVDTLRSSW